MFTKKDHQEHLGRVPLFATCSNKELDAVARAATELDVPQGRILTTQGRSSQEAFVILEGEAVVERNGTQVAEIGPGSTIGELGLLADVPRTATVTATTAMTLLVFTPDDFHKVLSDVPALSRSLLKVLARRVAEMDERYFG